MIASRLVAAAKLVAVDASSLLAKLSDVAGGLGDPIAWTDAQLATFAVSVTFPRDAWTPRRLANLVLALTGSKVLTRTGSIHSTDAMRVERAIGTGGFSAIGIDGPSATLDTRGATTLANELTACDVLGVAPSVCEELGRRLRVLADDAKRPRSFRAIVFPGDAGDDAVVELGVDVAPEFQPIVLLDLGVDEPLAKFVSLLGTPSHVRCRGRLDRIDNVFVEYRDPPADLCRQVVDLLAPGKSLAPFADALGANAVARMDLELALPIAVARFGLRPVA